MQRVLFCVTGVLLSAALQTAIFPVATTLPYLRAQLAWVALVPWLLVLFRTAGSTRRPVLCATLWSYLCGILWYAGNCYWIFQTMHLYGNLSLFMAAVVLVLFCLYLGLYHALFGAVAALLYRFGKARMHPILLSLLVAAAWVAVELARARVTSFPWDLLGYSQIDNAALTAFAPFAGVYAISFVVAFVNAGLTLALLAVNASHESGTPSGRASLRGATLTTAAIALLVAMLSGFAGAVYHAPYPAPDAQAIAVQPNLEPSSSNAAGLAPLEVQLAHLSAVAVQRSGMPEPHLVLWPEAPTPFELHEDLLQSTLTRLAADSNATVLADSNAVDPDPASSRHLHIYNAAGLFTGHGLQGRYNKIHLVPFGEFVPYADLFAFAGGLTEQVGSFDRGTRRVPLTDGAHRYGVFICYESIFPDEVRQLALKGADVLVNLSDDGWYGDTSAPFQHSNMARMRAIENRRWLLRDTNTGITESIDPYGNVHSAAPRHERLAIALPYAYTTRVTFYTRYGDLFAWFCAALTAGALLPAWRRALS